MWIHVHKQEYSQNYQLSKGFHKLYQTKDPWKYKKKEKISNHRRQTIKLIMLHENLLTHSTNDIDASIEGDVNQSN